MTLELTPEQCADLRACVNRTLAQVETDGFAQAKAQRLQSLLDLLAKSTAIILHQP